MRAVGIVVVVLVLAFSASALAGTVTSGGGVITYNADQATGASEVVDIGVENGQAFVYSDHGVTASGGCTQTDPNRVDCAIPSAFVVNMLGFDDRVDATRVTGAATIEAHGGGGGDDLRGAGNADRLYGDVGNDSLSGGGGSDVLEGGPGENYFYDGDGDDVANGGPNQDTFLPGTGRDTISGGDGPDTVDYTDRAAPVTITLDGNADDGEAGEGDNVRPDVESAFGGSAGDRIIATAGANTLRGGAGNDAITAGTGEQRVEGNEGDDVIDTRDGGYDSVDCGAGNDTLFADPDDSQSGCEVAPDRDGDRTLNEQDCAPDNPAVHPGAGEIFGNAVDEDCKGGPGYFKVLGTWNFDLSKKRNPSRVRFATLRLAALRAGDRIEVRCRGKGCPFKKATRTARSARLSLTGLFKRRYLRAGAVVEIRMLRANHVGRVVTLRVTSARTVKQSLSCLGVGATKPGICPLEG